MSSGRLRSAGQMNRVAASAGKNRSAETARPGQRGQPMAAITRTSTLRICDEPTRSNLAFLQDPQQLGLQFRRQIADLVRERSSPLPQLEPAPAHRERRR
jgi:hypothetical protein